MRFPFLELWAAPAGCEAQPGRRVAAPALLGRAADCDFHAALGSLSRRHCRLDAAGGRATLEDLGSALGTFVNGARLCQRVELRVGDWVELPYGLVFRVSDGAPLLAPYQPDDPLFRLVEAEVHDEGRWRVWADALLERAEPLGERIALGRGAGLADDAKALGGLSRELVDGGLEVDWSHGFVRRAVLRSVSRWPQAPWLETLGALLRHPLARLVEELEVDVLSYARGVDRAERTRAAEQMVEALGLLAAAPPLPWLHAARFGPTPDRLWNPRLEGGWRRARERHQRLTLGPVWVARAAWLQLRSAPHQVAVAGLEVGAQLKLDEDRATLVGSTPACAVLLEGPDGSPATAVALRLDRQNGLWVVEDAGAELRRGAPALYVNGRRCRHARLRPHDLLEPAPGLSFRFVME